MSYKVGNFCFDYQPFYIGKGCNSRCFDHIKESKKSKNKKIFLYKKISKIIKEGFSVDVKILKNKLSEAQAFLFEIEMIKLIGRYDKKLGPLVNCTDGGDGLTCPSIKTRQKISKKLKGRKILEQTKIKIGLANKGKILSISTREKISKERKNKPLSDETKRKISNTLKNKYKNDKVYIEQIKKANIKKSKNIVSQQTKDKRSFSMKNRDPLLEQERRQKISKKMKGIKRSEEFKQKVSKFHKNKKLSLETRAKISFSVRKHFQLLNNTCS